MKFTNDVVNPVHVYQAEKPVWKAMPLQVGRAGRCGEHTAGTPPYGGLRVSFAK